MTLATVLLWVKKALKAIAAWETKRLEAAVEIAVEKAHQVQVAKNLKLEILQVGYSAAVTNVDKVAAGGTAKQFTKIYDCEHKCVALADV